jgi:hypothetical protein
LHLAVLSLSHRFPLLDVRGLRPSDRTSCKEVPSARLTRASAFSPGKFVTMVMPRSVSVSTRMVARFMLFDPLWMSSRLADQSNFHEPPPKSITPRFLPGHQPTPGGRPRTPGAVAACACARRPRHRRRGFPQSSSNSRFTAGASGFLNLSQSRERPET